MKHQRSDEIHDTRRLRIRRPQMFEKKCNPSVTAEFSVTWPILSSELHKDQLLRPVEHPAGYRLKLAQRRAARG